MPRHRPAAIVLADSPLRERLRELSAVLESLRDEVAQLELEAETLRAELGAFEVRHRHALDAEQRALVAIGRVVRALEAWIELLRSAPARERVTRARWYEQRRAREAARERAQAVEREDEEEEPPPLPSAAELKSLYRRLARRFHPDLARTEEEQVRHAQVMARLNALYRAGDRAGMEALADQALGAELPEPALSLEEELLQLEARRARFESARDGLEEELRLLQGCATAELMRRVAAAAEAGEDLFAQLRRELKQRAKEALEDVRAVARALEDDVRRVNREALAGTGRRTLERAFDPLGRQRLVRLSLEALEGARVSAEARREAERLTALARSSPAAARLLLIAYASELVPHALDGLGTYEALSERFAWLSSGDRAPASLERTLVEAAEWVEFGVRRASAQRVQAGLRFRSAEVRDAVPLALRTQALRSEFRRVLAALGDRAACPECRTEVFAVPLYRLRGLDDLHASACPRCGTLLRSYFLPRGKDVQSVLNTAFLDLELLSEWTFRMGTASIAVQLLPVQVEKMTVAALKRRFWEDVLARHGVEVPFSAVRLVQGKRAVPERRRLRDLDRQDFRVAFSEKAKVSVADALETVRHRVRTRFLPDGHAAH
jgi:hypothetical protein